MKQAFSLLAVMIALAACKDDAPPASHHETPAASPSEIASALHVDAAAMESPSDPPPPAGDLRAEIDRFTTVDDCVKARASMDPLLGDALAAIGYDTFLVDACRILDALKAKSSKKCQPIDASMLRSRCERLAAIAAGDADACPLLAPARAELGRDATCVAAALRSSEMCAGEQTLERAACTALVGKDDAACGAFARPIERTRCLRDAHRFAPLLDANADAPKLATLPKIASKLSLEALGATETPDAGARGNDAPDEVSRGIVLVDTHDRLRFDLGEFRESSLGFVAPVPLSRTHFAIAVEASTSGKTTRVERAELSVPGVATLVYPAGRGDLKVTVEKLERVRGGAVTLVVEGEMGTSGRGYKTRWEVSTFVRDVVSPSALRNTSPALPFPMPSRDGGAR